MLQVTGQRRAMTLETSVRVRKNKEVMSGVNGARSRVRLNPIGSGAMRANPRLHWKAICNSQITTLLIYARSMTDTVVKKPRNTLWGKVTSQHLDHCHKYLFISPHHLVIGCRTSSHSFFLSSPVVQIHHHPQAHRSMLSFFRGHSCMQHGLLGVRVIREEFYTLQDKLIHTRARTVIAIGPTTSNILTVIESQSRST
jgi:hypothetical protein